MKFNAYLVFLLSTSVLLPSFVLYAYDVQSGLPYEMDQTSSRLTHGLYTNNIVEKLNFMKEAYIMLAPYHGNSGYFFPIENTDIDVTKRILLSSIHEIETELNTQDEKRWAFLPHNELNDYLNEQISDSDGRIDTYTRAYWHNPSTNPLLYVFLVLIFIQIPFILIVDARLNW